MSESVAEPGSVSVDAQQAVGTGAATSGERVGSPQPTATAGTVNGRPLKDILQLHLVPTRGRITWMLGVVPGNQSQDLDASAWILAQRHMTMRCGRSPAYQLWLNRATTGAPHPAPSDAGRIEPFVRDTFGLPDDRLPPNQVEGSVAQLVWYQVISELDKSLDGRRRLAHMEDLSFSVLEPGGDGLVVYGGGDSELVFRLWEIKKHGGTRAVSTSIALACDQLSDRGASYLAKFVGIGKGYTGELGLLYAELVDLWVDGSPRAGLGVAVATSDSHRPTRAFGGLVRRFPQFPAPDQREGLLLAFGDFRQFSQRVLEVLWSGL